MIGGDDVFVCVLPLTEGLLSHCLVVCAHESPTRVRDGGRVWRSGKQATHDPTSRTRNKNETGR